ncbi:hypothetical protein [Nostoc sp. CHAB 5715]|nr:hypothetical protein [Nostoc sp. CHAB 5715]MCC5623292.1 hypothetical protein [Nostoc sp. CHAB 5715]
MGNREWGMRKQGRQGEQGKKNYDIDQCPILRLRSVQVPHALCPMPNN